MSIQFFAIRVTICTHGYPPSGERITQRCRRTAYPTAINLAVAGDLSLGGSTYLTSFLTLGCQVQVAARTDLIWLLGCEGSGSGEMGLVVVGVVVVEMVEFHGGGWSRIYSDCLAFYATICSTHFSALC